MSLSSPKLGVCISIHSKRTQSTPKWGTIRVGVSCGWPGREDVVFILVTKGTHHLPAPPSALLWCLPGGLLPLHLPAGCQPSPGLPHPPPSTSSRLTKMYGAPTVCQALVTKRHILGTVGKDRLCASESPHCCGCGVSPSVGYMGTPVEPLPPRSEPRLPRSEPRPPRSEPRLHEVRAPPPRSEFPPTPAHWPSVSAAKWAWHPGKGHSGKAMSEGQGKSESVKSREVAGWVSRL